jgi:uncharacterized protein with HEPN domain
MAHERDQALLLDMLAAAREVRAYVGHGGFDAFLADGKSYRAVERCLEIIGEAARRLSPAARQAYPQVPWPKVVGLRNRISHEYGDIDYEEIFLIATVSVPELIAALEGTAAA